MSAPCSPFSSPSKLPGVNHVAPALSLTGEEATSTTIDDVSAFLPDELARQLKEDLDRQNVGSIYVPREVVWAIGLGGALVSAAVTLSPWTFCVMRNVRDHPFDPAQALRERAASLSSPPAGRSTSPPRRRRSAPPSPTMMTAARPPRRQNSASSSSSNSFDSAVAGLHSILHAPTLSASRMKAQRHVSFQLSEDQESAASLSDGDLLDSAPSVCSEPEEAVNEEAASRRVEIEARLAIDHAEKKHISWRRRWCPLCSRLRRKTSSPPPDQADSRTAPEAGRPPRLVPRPRS